MTATPSSLSRASGALLAALLPLGAWAIDVDPADYVPAPPGTTAGLLYYQHAGRDRLYAQGRQALPDPRLTSDVGIVRLVRYLSLGGLTVAPQVLVPFGRLQAGRDTASLGRTSGVGDLIVAAPVWLVNDPESSTYLGVSPYLYLPTGSYDRNRALNLGENRWKFNLQVGFVKGLTAHWHVDLTFDSMFHGKNDDFGPTGRTLKQDRLDQGQAYLRYQFTPGTNAFVGVSQAWGGATRVDGVGNGDETRQRKVSLGASHFIQPTTQVMVAVGRDLKVENGFKENARINLRLLHVF